MVAEHKITPQGPQIRPTEERLEEPNAAKVADENILIKSNLERSEAHTIPVYDATMPVFTPDTRDTLNDPKVLTQILDGISSEGTANHRQVLPDGLIYSNDTSSQISNLLQRIKAFENYRDAETGLQYFDSISVTLEHHEYNGTLAAALFDAFINTTPDTKEHLYISTTNEKSKVDQTKELLLNYATARTATMKETDFYFSQGALRDEAPTVVDDADHVAYISMELYGKTLHAYIIHKDNLHRECDAIVTNIIQKEKARGLMSEFFDPPFSDQNILNVHAMNAQIDKIRYRGYMKPPKTSLRSHRTEFSCTVNVSAMGDSPSPAATDKKRIAEGIRKLEKAQAPIRTKLIVVNYPSTAEIPSIPGYSHYTRQISPKQFKTSNNRIIMYFQHRMIVTLGPDIVKVRAGQDGASKKTILQHNPIAVHCPECNRLLLDSQGKVREICAKCNLQGSYVKNPTMRGNIDAAGISFLSKKTIQTSPNSSFTLRLPAAVIRDKPKDPKAKEPLPVCISGIKTVFKGPGKTKICVCGKFLRGNCQFSATPKKCARIHPDEKWIEENKKKEEAKKKLSPKQKYDEAPLAQKIQIQEKNIIQAATKMIDARLEGRGNVTKCYTVDAKFKKTGAESRKYIPTITFRPKNLSELRETKLPDGDLKAMQMLCSQTMQDIVNGRNHKGTPKTSRSLHIQVTRQNQPEVLNYTILRGAKSGSVIMTMGVLNSRENERTTPREFKEYADRAFADMKMSSVAQSPISANQAFMQSRTYEQSVEQLEPIRKELSKRGFSVQISDLNKRTADSMLYGSGVGSRQRAILSYIMQHSHEERFRCMIPRTQELANFLSKKADVLLVEDGDHMRPEILSDCNFEVQTPKCSYHSDDDYIRMFMTALALSEHRLITVINGGHTESAKGPHSAKRIIDAACESLGIPVTRLVKSKNERKDLYTVSNHITENMGIIGDPDPRYISETSIAYDTFNMNFAQAIALATENYNNELSTNGFDFSGVLTNPKGSSQVCVKERFETGETEDPRTECMRQDNGPRDKPEVFLEERTTCKADPINALYPGKSTGWNKVEAAYSFKHDTRIILRRREVRQEPNENSAILGYRERGSFYNITKKTSVFYPGNSMAQKVKNKWSKFSGKEVANHGTVKIFHEVPYGNAIGYIIAEQYQAVQYLSPKVAQGEKPWRVEATGERLSVIDYLFNESNRKIMKDRKTNKQTNRFTVDVHNKLPGLEGLTGFRAVKYRITPKFYKHPKRPSTGAISAAYDSYFHSPDTKYLESLKEELEVSSGLTYVLKLAYYEAVRLYSAILPTPQVLMVLPRYESVLHEKYKDCRGKPMKQKTVLRSHKNELLERMKSLKEVPFISKDGRSVTFERPKSGGHSVLEMIIYSEMYRNNQDEEYLYNSQLGTKVETTIPQHKTGLERISASCYNALTFFSGLLIATGTVAIVKHLVRAGIAGMFGCPADYSETSVDGIANTATAITGCIRSWQGIAWNGIKAFAGTTSVCAVTGAAIIGTPIACAVSAALGVAAKGIRMLASKRSRQKRDNICNSRLKVLASGLQIASEETQPPLIRMGCASLEAYYGHYSTLALHGFNTTVSMLPYVLYGAGAVAMPGFLVALGACLAGQCGIHALWNMLACPESPSIMNGLLDATSEGESSDEEDRETQDDVRNHSLIW